MARELADRARERGQRVLWGECVPLQAGELPYAPLVAALRGRGAETGVALDRLLTELRDGRGGGAPATPQAPARLFELLLGALGRLAETTPTVLVVEDIHWADHATQDLAALPRPQPARRAAADPGDAAHRRAGAAGRCGTCSPSSPAAPRVERLELARLDGRGHGAAGRGHRRRGRRRGARRVGPRAGGGQPLLRRGAARGARRRRARGRPPGLAARRAAHAHGGPRRGAAPGGPRRGRRRPRHRPRAARPRRGPRRRCRSRAALRELVAAHVLVCDAAAERYRFRHALAGEAVYAELLPPERRALHAAIARALEAAVPAPDRGAAEWAALAQHWDGAHDEAAALRSSVAAAAAAHAVYAFEAARGHLERARALWERVAPAARPDGPRRGRAAAAARRRHALRGRPRGRDPDRRGRARARRRRRGARARRLDPHPARHPAPLARARAASSSSARSSCCRPGPSRERAAAMAWIGKHLIYGELPERHARVRARGARGGARGGRARRGGHRRNETLGVAFAYGGDPETGLAHYREAIRIAREVGRGDRLAAAINNLGDALTDARAARRGAHGPRGRLRGGPRRSGWRSRRALVLQVTMAECELRLGRWDEAAARLERLLERQPRRRAAARSRPACSRAIRARQGDFAAARGARAGGRARCWRRTSGRKRS